MTTFVVKKIRGDETSHLVCGVWFRALAQNLLQIPPLLKIVVQLHRLSNLVTSSLTHSVLLGFLKYCI